MLLSQLPAALSACFAPLLAMLNPRTAGRRRASPQPRRQTAGLATRNPGGRICAGSTARAKRQGISSPGPGASEFSYLNVSLSRKVQPTEAKGFKSVPVETLKMPI
jgi:hypothetical protein